MDDYFVHQTIDTVDHVAVADARFTDRLYFNVHGRPGAFVLGCGIGAFPNQGVMDGFINAVHGDRQYNLRVARPLQNDRERMYAGPFHLEIAEPLAMWRLALDSNNFGIAFDLTFHARAAPFEHRPIFRRIGGQVEWHQQHFQQSGDYEGWVEIGGAKMVAEGLWGSRDRSWGVRGPQPGTVHPPQQAFPPGGWLSAQFEDRVIHGWFSKTPQGRNGHIDGAVTPVGGEPGPNFVDWSYEVLASDATGATTQIRLSFELEDGGREKLDVSPIMARDASGSGHNKGFFGTRRREVHLEGEVWNHADPVFRGQNGFMHGEVLCKFEHRGRTGFGIFQTAFFRRAG